MLSTPFAASVAYRLLSGSSVACGSRVTSLGTMDGAVTPAAVSFPDRATPTDRLPRVRLGCGIPYFSRSFFCTTTLSGRWAMTRVDRPLEPARLWAA